MRCRHCRAQAGGVILSIAIGVATCRERSPPVRPGRRDGCRLGIFELVEEVEWLGMTVKERARFGQGYVTEFGAIGLDSDSDRPRRPVWPSSFTGQQGRDGVWTVSTSARRQLVHNTRLIVSVLPARQTRRQPAAGRPSPPRRKRGCWNVPGNQALFLNLAVSALA